MRTSVLASLLVLTATTAGCMLNKDGPGGPEGETAGSAAAGGSAGAATGTSTSPATAGGNVAAGANVPTPVAGPLAAAPRFIGRVGKTQLLTWPGTAVEAAFTGSRGTATFAVNGGTNYVGVSVDGGAPTRVLVANNAPIAFGPVAKGSHTVRFTKLNEAELGTFRFVSLVTDGTLTVPTPSARRLEFIGDSITLGYGVEGTRPCTNSSAMENVLKAWSGLTAEALGAEASVIAWSGHGLLRNGVGVADTTTLPTLYLRTDAQDTVTRYDFPAAGAPQAVIINLGTNDFTRTGGGVARAALDTDAFTQAYATFVQLVRSKYPSATIVLATSPMLSDSYPTTAEAQHSTLMQALTAVQTQLGDANLRLLDIPTMDSTIAACDYHPSAAEQQAMSGLLVTELKSALGW